MEQKRPRNANGTFGKGGPPPAARAHRQRGVSNKITRDIRDGAIAGFARHGSNGRGEGGFAGYCFYLAKRHPKAAARLIEKLLPLTVNATGTTGHRIGTVNVISVPVDHYLSAEDIARIRSAQPLIEHEQPAQLAEPPRLDEQLNGLPTEELQRLADMIDDAPSR